MTRKILREGFPSVPGQSIYPILAKVLLGITRDPQRLTTWRKRTKKLTGFIVQTDRCIKPPYTHTRGSRRKEIVQVVGLHVSMCVSSLWCRWQCRDTYDCWHLFISGIPTAKANQSKSSLFSPQMNTREEYFQQSNTSDYLLSGKSCFCHQQTRSSPQDVPCYTKDKIRLQNLTVFLSKNQHSLAGTVSKLAFT